MNNSKELNEEKRKQLEDQLKEAGISKVDLAKAAGVSARSVTYFFSEGRNSKKIHDAALQLLNENLNHMIHTVHCRHQNIIKLGQAS